MQRGDTCQVEGKVKLVSSTAQHREMEHDKIDDKTGILVPESNTQTHKHVNHKTLIG